MSLPTLDCRLMSAAGLVRRGVCLADVGTDHGYLPIYLLLAGHIERAVLTDINEGPLCTARENVAQCGIPEGRVTFLLTDGAGALCDSGADDYAVCGMGGELIADIIEGAPHLFRKGIRLILQPMTRTEHLRTYLLTHGFDIIEEVYSSERGRHYVTLLAEYSGICRAPTCDEAYLGRLCCSDALSECERAYLISKRDTLARQRDGKERGGLDATEETQLIETITQLLKA